MDIINTNQNQIQQNNGFNLNILNQPNPVPNNPNQNNVPGNQGAAQGQNIPANIVELNNKLDNQIKAIGDSINSMKFNMNFVGSGVNQSDNFNFNANNDTIKVVQQRFWSNMSAKKSIYCAMCGGLRHENIKNCPRRCYICRGNHDATECPQKITCPWCGQKGGIHVCEAKKEFPNLSTRCAACHTKGHAAKDCQPLYLVMNRLINTLKSFKSKRKKTIKRIRKRFRGIKKGKK